MNKKDKELLLKDLSVRLPYGVKFESENAERVYFIDTSDDEIYINGTNIENCKPYLFPLSSMTEEQRKEYYDLCDITLTEYGYPIWFDSVGSIDWLNKNHFDYRGLIEKGLAIDCTNLNIY